MLCISWPKGVGSSCVGFGKTVRRTSIANSHCVPVLSISCKGIDFTIDPQEEIKVMNHLHQWQPGYTTIQRLRLKGFLRRMRFAAQHAAFLGTKEWRSVFLGFVILYCKYRYDIVFQYHPCRVKASVSQLTTQEEKKVVTRIKIQLRYGDGNMITNYHTGTRDTTLFNLTALSSLLVLSLTPSSVLPLRHQ